MSDRNAALIRANIRDLDHFEARFWLKVDPNGPIPEHRPELGPCWVWLGYIDRYGKVGIYAPERRVEWAHRVAYALTYGEVPAGLNVLHRCDYQPCVRPTHLFLGTALDNTRDMDAKGRRVVVAPRGSAHGEARLTESDVAEIRAAYQAGVFQLSLAKRYGVTQTAISRIVRGEGWKHVGGPIHAGRARRRKGVKTTE